MVVYEYVCDNCNRSFEESHHIKDRDYPTKFPCPRCLKYSIRRVISVGGFSVPEGSCGNAANGYSTYVGDAENFKAKSEGRKPPYEGVERLKDI